MTDTKEMRFEFGNWHRFVKRNLTQERCDIAKTHILDFIGQKSLDGRDFLDIGCGSGLHSLGAWQAGAGRLHSFDYDETSVLATRYVRNKAGNPANWVVERGDVLDEVYVGRLGRWNLVYSWGVLHHTGDVWRAIVNAQKTVGDGGLFYLALYASDVQPQMDYWLAIKREYNQAGPLKRRRMVWDYIWNHMIHHDLSRLPEVANRMMKHKLTRGMSMLADIRDWLGGWPMQFTADQDVVDLLEQQHGFKLVNVATGQACSEYLFERTGMPAERTIVTELVGSKKAMAEMPLGNTADEPKCSWLELLEDGVPLGPFRSAASDMASEAGSVSSTGPTRSVSCERRLRLSQQRP